MSVSPPTFCLVRFHILNHHFIIEKRVRRSRAKQGCSGDPILIGCSTSFHWLPGVKAGLQVNGFRAVKQVVMGPSTLRYFPGGAIPSALICLSWGKRLTWGIMGKGPQSSPRNSFKGWDWGGLQAVICSSSEVYAFEVKVDILPEPEAPKWD